MSGTATVLCVVGLARPSESAAQAIGTMQVIATVTPADISWSGLSAAQQIARDFVMTHGAGEVRRVDLPLIHIDLETPDPPGGSAQPAISIQYLRN